MASKSETEISDTQNPTSTQSNVQIVRTKPRISDLLVITGHIHQLREWSERLDDLYIYETMGTVVAIYEAYSVQSRTSPFNETILVIKDKVRIGQTYKIICPVYDRPLPPHVSNGCTIRVVGKLINKYSMRAIKVTCPTYFEINHFDRITHVCYHRIMKYLQEPTIQ